MQMQDPWQIKDGDLCEYNWQQEKEMKNVGDANYSPVTMKPYGTMSMGFVD